MNNVCPTCLRVFLTPDQLESHSGTHEQCEQCDKKVISKIALENHINETHMGKILKVIQKGGIKGRLQMETKLGIFIVKFAQ